MGKPKRKLDFDRVIFCAAHLMHATVRAKMEDTPHVGANAYGDVEDVYYWHDELSKALGDERPKEKAG